MQDPRYTISKFLCHPHSGETYVQVQQKRGGGGVSSFIAPIDRLVAAGIDLYLKETLLFVVDPKASTGPYYTMGIFKTATLRMWRRESPNDTQPTSRTGE